MKALICLGLVLAAYSTGYWVGQADASQSVPVAKCLNDDSIRVLKANRKPIPRCDP